MNELGIRPEPVREVPMLLWEQDPDVLRIPRGAEELARESIVKVYVFNDK